MYVNRWSHQQGINNQNLKKSETQARSFNSQKKHTNIGKMENVKM